MDVLLPKPDPPPKVDFLLPKLPKPYPPPKLDVILLPKPEDPPPEFDVLLPKLEDIPPAFEVLEVPLLPVLLDVEELELLLPVEELLLLEDPPVLRASPATTRTKMITLMTVQSISIENLKNCMKWSSPYGWLV